MTTVLKITITSPDGEVKEHSFNKSQVDSAPGPLVTIAPNEIGEINIEKWPFPITDVAKYIALEPGEVDLENDIHLPTRERIEKSFEFCGTDGWDYIGLETIEFGQRFVWVDGATFDGWLWSLPLIRGGYATVLVTDTEVEANQELVQYSWYSESGGPVSWDGRYSLFQLPNNIFASVTSGDRQDDASVWQTDGSKQALIDSVAEFCLEEDRIIDVALCLEEKYETPASIELQGELSPLIESLHEYGGLWLDESFAHEAELKEILASRSEEYRFIRDFFADPKNPKFHELWQALVEAAETGYSGEVTGDLAEWYVNLHQLAKEGKY